MTIQSLGKACAWIFRCSWTLWAQAQSLTEKAQAVYQRKACAASAQLHRKYFMQLREKFCLVGVGLLFCQVLIVNAQIGIVDKDAKTKPTITIFGSYHLGNQGQNVVKSKVADITAPERQKQIVELIEKLKKFKPTKIVIEIDSEDDAKTQELYDKYLTGSYQLSKNETNQIGFRLAKELGHKKVYCVD